MKSRIDGIDVSIHCPSTEIVRNGHQKQNGRKHANGAAKFVGAGAKNRIKWCKISLRHNVRGCDQRIGGNKIVRMSEQVGTIEDQSTEKGQCAAED
jgi:hypothetical protein